MEQALSRAVGLKWYSPRTTRGSLILAALAHVGIYGGVLAFLAIAALHSTQPVDSPSEEIAYETFTEPPVPTKIVRQVKTTPEPEKPVDPVTKPDTTPKELQDSQSTVAGTQTAAKQAATTGAEGQGDATATPYYRIKPKYPRAALVAGLEGWVLMKIDITESGEVENVRVIDGQERNTFQDEARRAVAKWKYKPFLDAMGKPIRKMNHEVRVDFKLSDAA